MSRVQLLVKPAPDAIIDAINGLAETENESAQDVVARILADHVGLSRLAPEGGGSFNGQVGYGKVFTRVPAEVKQKLAMEAARRGLTLRGVVLAALANHFQLPVPDGRRQRPTRTEVTP